MYILARLCPKLKMPPWAEAARRLSHQMPPISSSTGRNSCSSPIQMLLELLSTTTLTPCCSSKGTVFSLLRLGIDVVKWVLVWSAMSERTGVLDVPGTELSRTVADDTVPAGTCWTSEW